MTPTRRIYVSEPDLSGNEEKYVVEAIRSSWISSTGAFVEIFERDFAEACGTKHCLSVCNGTVGLHLALLAMDVRPGDEVLVPAMSFVATANAVRYLGAEPVFVDVDPNTWCIDVVAARDAITASTRGILPVHLYGHPAPMQPLSALAAEHGLWIVEDAAEAHLATYRGRAVGGLANAGVFSFYGNKTLTCGEGGAVVVDDDALARCMRLLRGQGMDPTRRYFHDVVGYNYRLTNVACAILCAQLERAEAIMARRRAVRDAYAAQLPSDKVTMQQTAPDCEPSPWMVAVTFPDAQLRDAAAEALASSAVETRPFFHPLHRLPPYRASAIARGTRAPQADRLAAVGLCLPTHTNMSDQDIDRVCRVLHTL